MTAATAKTPTSVTPECSRSRPRSAWPASRRCPGRARPPPTRAVCSAHRSMARGRRPRTRRRSRLHRGDRRRRHEADHGSLGAAPGRMSTAEFGVPTTALVRASVAWKVNNPGRGLDEPWPAPGRPRRARVDDGGEGRRGRPDLDRATARQHGGQQRRGGACRPGEISSSTATARSPPARQVTEGRIRTPPLRRHARSLPGSRSPDWSMTTSGAGPRGGAGRHGVRTATLVAPVQPRRDPRSARRFGSPPDRLVLMNLSIGVLDAPAVGLDEKESAPNEIVTPGAVDEGVATLDASSLSRHARRPPMLPAPGHRSRRPQAE